MSKIKKSVLVVAVLVTVFMVSGYSKITLTDKKVETIKAANQTINMFVTHGHCSTPFAGKVNDLKVEYPTRLDLGNPLEDMVISFEVDPNSFNVCRAKELTPRIKTPGLFISEKNEKITFTSTNVYTMGLDWYQVNGKMAIKGVEKDVKLFVTGIRKPNEQIATTLVLDGQVNLFDWGIDYDLIVNGKSSEVSTKWLYLNMKIELV
ncbi:YceI family protein [uncultured Tenacibaculum sp.]|uniref:YceI family protein n=1 Tax=uncultured Tenacibaculum sp. TaxID=174713 RepID=UPI00262546A2|nr:YceI family protein [uncultured Tenacibaculum sp.]